MKNLKECARAAKSASRSLRLLSTQEKNDALLAIATSLEKHRPSILEANKKDLEISQSFLSQAMLDRLSLHERLDGIISDVRHVASLPDPVGTLIEDKVLPNGLKIQKQRVPIGVLGVIYEARPNVTVDTVCLALKTGNAALLKGGKEAINTNHALMDAIHEALLSCSLAQESFQLIQTQNRSQLKKLLQLDEEIDLIIPRGGQGLQAFCRKESTIPVLTGGVGICHLYVDKTADVEKTINVVVNAKISRPTVCNALNTLLVNKEIAHALLPSLTSKLTEKGVSCRLDPKAWHLYPEHQQAHEKDWNTEWLSLVLGIKIVDNLEEAVQHIHSHSTGHSDGILTQTESNAEAFIQAIDSAAVYINASTRFTDGAEFGLGAEIAVSTQKLHARGPVALEELTSYKWIVKGDYHIRGEI